MDDCTLLCLQLERFRQLRREILDSYTQLSTADLAVRDQLLGNIAGHVDWDREPDADVSARRADDRGVDPNQFAPQIDQRTTGIAGIDRGVGLDEIFVAFDAKPAATDGADDAEGGSLLQPEWVPDGNDVVANPQLVGISQRHAEQTAGLDLDDCYIGGEVSSDLLRSQVLATAQRDRHLVRILYDVRIGEDVAPPSVEDHSRPRRLELALLRLLSLRNSEKMAEKGVSQQRVLFGHLVPAHGNADDTGQNLLQYWRERRRLIARGLRARRAWIPR